MWNVRNSNIREVNLIHNLFEFVLCPTNSEDFDGQTDRRTIVEKDRRTNGQTDIWTEKHSTMGYTKCILPQYTPKLLFSVKDLNIF